MFKPTPENFVRDLLERGKDEMERSMPVPVEEKRICPVSISETTPMLDLSNSSGVKDISLPFNFAMNSTELFKLTRGYRGLNIMDRIYSLACTNLANMIAEFRNNENYYGFMSRYATRVGELLEEKNMISYEMSIDYTNNNTIASSLEELFEALSITILFKLLAVDGDDEFVNTFVNIWKGLMVSNIDTLVAEVKNYSNIDGGAF